MDLIANYDSGSEEPEVSKRINALVPKININPDVDCTDLQIQQQTETQLKLHKMYNQPQKVTHLIGKIEKHYMNPKQFDEQYQNFQNFGFAHDPQGENNKVVFNQYLHPQLSQEVKQGKIITIDDKVELVSASIYAKEDKNERNQRKNLQNLRVKEWNAGSSDFQGPWGGLKEDPRLQSKEEQEEKQKLLSLVEEKKQQKLEEKQVREQFLYQSNYYGDEEYDYQGRSWLLPQSNLKPVYHSCYIPKKLVHTWMAHQKGVQVIRYFPKYGNFLLSASIDCKIKLWSTTQEKKLMRDYIGHREAVRDITFSNDGFHFLSASYDKMVNYWDTETGKVVQSFNTKKYPYCVRLNPEQQTSFLCANSNKKINQYDLRSGTRTLQYDEHLSAVNTVTFLESGRKFVSTSDDKKIFIWEFGIPVVVKHMSEPDMHAITQTAMHPSYNYFAGQSSDNYIKIYETKAGNFRPNRKKRFSGHQCAGYAIGICFSPDGQFLASGDNDGKIWFWDWKTQKNFRTFEAHQGVCMSVDWHPLEPSKFASCGWDGTIKLWD